MPGTRERLRAIREYRRLSQDEVAAWLGISQQAYGKKERGESDGFSPDDFEMILARTQIDARWLFGQRTGPIESADLRINPGSEEGAQTVREFFDEYRALKASSASTDYLTQRLASDFELRDFVEALIHNRGEVGRVRGYLERILDERNASHEDPPGGGVRER